MRVSPVLLRITRLLMSSFPNRYDLIHQRFLLPAIDGGRWPQVISNLKEGLGTSPITPSTSRLTTRISRLEQHLAVTCCCTKAPRRRLSRLETQKFLLASKSWESKLSR